MNNIAVPTILSGSVFSSQELERLRPYVENLSPEYSCLLPFLPKEVQKLRTDYQPATYYRLLHLQPALLGPIPENRVPAFPPLLKHKVIFTPVPLIPEQPVVNKQKVSSAPHKITHEHFQFGYTPSPLYPLSARQDMKNSWIWLRYNMTKKRVFESISTGISLFGKPIHIAFAINYIANAVLLAVKTSINMIKTLVPVLGLCVGGIELVKEILDTSYIYKTSRKINKFIDCLAQKLPKLKQKIETDLSYQKILGKKVINLLLEEIEKGKNNDPNAIQNITNILLTQLKKAKIVHGISIACLSLTVASFLATMLLVPYSVFFGVSASYTILSFVRTALLQCYLYEPGHKFAPKKIIPPLIRKRAFPIVKRCFGQLSSSHSSSTLMPALLPAPTSWRSNPMLKRF